MVRQLLLISGSTRGGSTNTATLRTAATLVPPETDAELYAGLSDLPAYNPDDDHDPLNPAVADLRNAAEVADAVLFCTPEYAGSLPGSFKNLLDWLVGSVALSDKAIAWINVSSIAAPSGGAGAHDSLRTALGWVQARIIEDACLRLPLSRNDVGDDGLVQGADHRELITGALTVLLNATEATPETAEPA